MKKETFICDSHSLWKWNDERSAVANILIKNTSLFSNDDGKEE